MVPRRPSTNHRVMLLVALLTPALFPAYLLLLGDPYLPEPLGPHHGEPRLWVLYIAPLAALGAVIPATRTGLPLTSILAVFALVALPFYSPGAIDGSLFAVNFPALFALVLVLIVAGSEWTLRNPTRARDVFTPQTVRLALAAGVGHAVVAHGLRTIGFGFELAGPSAVSLAIAVWMLAGAIVLGATPTFLYTRYRLLAPTVVVVVLFTWTAWSTYQHVQELRETGAAMAAAFTPFTAYLVAWFLVVALATIAGWLELTLR